MTRWTDSDGINLQMVLLLSGSYGLTILKEEDLDLISERKSPRTAPWVVFQ